jgi:hypothetical protein
MLLYLSNIRKIKPKPIVTYVCVLVFITCKLIDKTRAFLNKLHRLIIFISFLQFSHQLQNKIFSLPLNWSHDSTMTKVSLSKFRTSIHLLLKLIFFFSLGVSTSKRNLESVKTKLCKIGGETTCLQVTDTRGF